MEKIGTMVTLSTCSKEQLSNMIDTYEKLVFSICYKITGDYFAAEDLSQETFLTAFQKYASFDGSNEKAWICRIATNKSIDYMKTMTAAEIAEKRGANIKTIQTQIYRARDMLKKLYGKEGPV